MNDRYTITPPAKVALGFCYRTSSPSEFIVSAIRAWTEIPEIQHGGVIYQPSGADWHGLARARNRLTKEFLDGKADALLMVDTDMIFFPDDVRKLIDHNVPIAAGLYMADTSKADAGFLLTHGRTKPEVMFIETGPEKPLPTEANYVHFAGAGFMLVKREVFLAISDEWGWFDYVEPTDEKPYIGEDWDFCARAREAGFEILLDPTVTPGHLKTLAIRPGSLEEHV